MKTVSSVLLLALFISTSDAWRVFHKGRSQGGNLGSFSPSKNFRNVTTGTRYYQTPLPPEQWFSQKLNHFDATDQRTWKQLYFTSDYRKPSNLTAEKTIVFLSVGGEGPINATWMREGHWIETAKNIGALCFQLEHRYYGKSHPTPDMSVANLRYLSSQQALADLALFIESMNEKHNLNNPVWIAFGGSYPGSLAAWLRYKYPHLVAGSMSASGPLLAKLDFYEYFAVVEDSLRTHSDQCVQAVLEGTNKIEELLKTKSGQRMVDEMFQLCDPIENTIVNDKDVANLFETLSGNFANVVQYNKDNRKGKFPKASKITIDTLCDIMTNENDTPLERLANVNSLTLEAYEEKCVDYKYDTMVDALRNTSWNAETAEGGRQWTYQTCTEFGFYQTSSHKPQLFGTRFPIEFWVQQCEDIFGPKFNDNYLQDKIRWTNDFYGALNLKVSNVVFVHGSIDPWHALGITKSNNPKAPAIYIKGTAHCANMYPSSPNDTPQLVEARKLIDQFIIQWINDH